MSGTTENTTPRRKPGHSPLWMVGLLFFGLVTATAGLTALRLSQQPRPELPVYGQVPDFTLTERGGQSVGLEQLRGKVWVADFIFTRCAGPCPVLSARLAELQKRFEGREPLRLVSVTVDPAHDGVEQLREYAERYGANAKRWWFLTGSAEAIDALVRGGFKLGTQMPEPGSTDVIHSTRLVLVDPEGRIRGYYDGTEMEEASRLIEDLDGMLRKVEG